MTRECFLGDRTVVGEFAVEFDAAYGSPFQSVITAAQLPPSLPPALGCRWMRSRAPPPAAT